MCNPGGTPIALMFTVEPDQEMDTIGVHLRIHGGLKAGCDERADPAAHLRKRCGRIVIKYLTVQEGASTRDSPHLSSSGIGCREHGLSLAQFRVLLQLRVPFSGFLMTPRHSSDQRGITRSKGSVWGTHQKILKFACGSLKPCRGIVDHFLALAH